ncbi:MAG: NADH-quinone oxidoreductase subunit C [Bacteroidales bacterium]|jgi:Ni,Fe-hydrogenase III large subunit/NADH:ubiquinone oxidoreductase subunit C|nr:NADH-quinone oxidoreductase subunit C [Bacteroidales bacterium]
MQQLIRIANNQAIETESIPVLPYDVFLQKNSMLPMDERYHCVSYFAHPENRQLRLICCIADDQKHDILVSSCMLDADTKALNSFTAVHESFHLFEREIHENYGIKYTDHPWLKPVRYAHDRANPHDLMNQYPFFSIRGEALHEVGVGPIHAGIIEPGYFRFTCNGEKILHLEIQLGYQHRGVEQLFLTKKSLNQRIQLAENIAGDSTIAHSSAFALVWEALSGYQTWHPLLWVQALALEIERIAMHTADLSALCGDIAYQLGNSVYGRLRTPIINFFQAWTGNRFARTLIRPAHLFYPFTDTLAMLLRRTLLDFERDFRQMGDFLFNMPGVLSRFEKTGIVSDEQSSRIGTVGMTARASGRKRDIRSSHPDEIYRSLNHQPVMYHIGDVWARARIRHEEVLQSIGYIHELLREMPHPEEIDHDLKPAMPGTFALSMVEGWRGEICHCAITGHDGALIRYKITDPSFHNWTALALAVRNNEISDFPICNKSFNLSYCGFDL